VRLRIRGLFEPTTIAGGEAPDPAHPYYQVAGIVRARDWSAWHIDVSNPKQTYWLNHYPRVGHKIYKEDFEATIPMAAGGAVTVRVVDGNDRQMDNAEPGLPDRMQIVAGVTDKPLDGQMLRLDVRRVTVREPRDPDDRTLLERHVQVDRMASVGLVERLERHSRNREPKCGWVAGN